jgi:hypothetical protein
MTKEVQTPVVDAEFTEVVEAPVQEAQVIKCAISVGMTEKGDIFFNVEGADQNLLLMEGLLKYAERHMSRVWEGRLEAQGQAE